MEVGSMEDDLMEDKLVERNQQQDSLFEENEQKSEIKVSIIIPAKNEGTNVEMTVDSFLNSSTPNIPFEIIVINDNSQDHCCDFLSEALDYWQGRGVRLLQTEGIGAANARNLGAAHARGEILIFSDAHVLVEKGWMEKILAALAQPGVDVVAPGIAVYDDPQRVGYGWTWDDQLKLEWLPAPKEVTPIPLAPGGLTAFKRAVFETVGGFDNGFKIWGHEDVELSLKCWLFGFNVYVTPEVIVRHIFRTLHTYSVTNNEVYYNLLRMAISHFDRKRIVKVINMVRKVPFMEQVLADITVSNVFEQRQEYLSKRKYDDDWFMSKFGIPY